MVNFKKMLIFALMGFSIFCLPNFGFAQTQKDIEFRERLIRIEEGQKALNQRIDALDKRIDNLDNKLSKNIDHIANLIFVVLAGMFTLVGFVLWDRRTALAPAVRKNKELEEREEKLEKALKEFALKNPDMKEILKNLGLF